MFWDTQTLTNASKIAETHMGPVGRYTILKDPQFSAVVLSTDKYGRFWYGDIDLPLEEPMVQLVANELNETVYVMPEFDVTSTRTMKQQSLWIFYPETTTA